MIFPASGTGAWEAALVNTLSPGDKVLMVETGHFATLWSRMAARLGLEVDFIPGDWRHGVDPAAVEARLAEDRARKIKAVCIVHNETSTGVASRVAEVRKAIDAARHPALFMVDTISSLASIDYRHDEWGVDVTVAGSQKGLMLPPGLSFNAVSEKARAAGKTASLPRSYWSWDEMLRGERGRLLPLHAGDQPALRAAGRRSPCCSRRGSTTSSRATTAMRRRRGARCGPGASKCCCLDAARVFELAHGGADAAPATTPTPSASDPRALQHVARQRARQARRARYSASGTLGDFNDLMLAGTLAGVEMGLLAAGVEVKASGVAAALAYLGGNYAAAPASAA